jgi:hypothetical protein
MDALIARIKARVADPLRVVDAGTWVCPIILNAVWRQTARGMNTFPRIAARVYLPGLAQSPSQRRCRSARKAFHTATEREAA